VYDSFLTEKKIRVNDIWDTNAPIATKRSYQKQLNWFYNFSKVVHNLEDLAKCPSDVLQEEIELYCDFQNRRVKKAELSPNSVRQNFVEIKNALDDNYRENDIKWR